jgi:hypothetical protein
VPTHDETPRFLLRWGRLSPAQQQAFLMAVRLLVDALRTGRANRRLRVKPVKTMPDVFEMTWAPDGRALFRYGEPLPGRDGPHIVWVDIGTHDVFRSR